MNKARRQKWLALIAREPDGILCSYCKHLSLEAGGTWEYPETETICTSPLIDDTIEMAIALDNAWDGKDCWRFANKLPYKEAERVQ